MPHLRSRGYAIDWEVDTAGVWRSFYVLLGFLPLRTGLAISWRDDPIDWRTKCKFKYPSGGVLHLIWNAVGTVRFQFTVACDLNAKSKVHVRSEGVKPSVLRRGVLLSVQSFIGSSTREEEFNFKCYVVWLFRFCFSYFLLSIMDVTFNAYIY